ncbi:hypothetical protein [Halanaeroarchaeum sulfurireducens]|uniref:Uncharacterized protein n=1 Tax=Halanaeroarchaeum sulfurireducens TaxID=1604004 RepID=A0A0N7FTZ0_9EURY|nr:hypothetical protein [Halanaeroarchaeum sulfurireducens]ALG82895.1 hypothetical protein HLASA_2020 [Halanaeroarchaeum sulfurireducens]
MAHNAPEGGGGDSGGLNIVATLRKFVDDSVRGIYTTSTVIVVGVDEATRRAEVELKADRNALVDNVPIASPFATDGAGMIAPVQEGDEGLLFHAREPIEKQLATSGEVAPEGERRFTLEAGVFFPEIWLDDMDVPDHEDGEFQIAIQDDGSALRMFPDGRVRVEHTSGKVIAMDATGAVTIGDEASAAAVLNADAELEYEDTQPDGSTSTKTVDVIDPGTTDLDSS